VDVVPDDFFVDPLPAGQDIVLMANVIHLFSSDLNRDLLRRVRIGDGAYPALSRSTGRARPQRNSSIAARRPPTLPT